MKANLKIKKIADTSEKELEIKRLDIISALVYSEDNPLMKLELLKLVNEISISEMQTKTHVKSIKVTRTGNEALIEYIKEYA